MVIMCYSQVINDSIFKSDYGLIKIENFSLPGLLREIIKKELSLC